ncbi:MAG: hypothetical protein K2X97_02910, partial [Mycobacteriaceae bacterium]|nr:hypothetical protein [Mycobacteriaceae bacterium]
GAYRVCAAVWVPCAAAAAVRRRGAGVAAQFRVRAVVEGAGESPGRAPVEPPALGGVSSACAIGPDPVVDRRSPG